MFLEQKALSMYVSEMAGDQPRIERVPLLLTKDELQELDDWQFAHRMRTRSDAVRKMMQIAIDVTAGKREGEGAEAVSTAQSSKPKRSQPDS